MFDEWDLSRFDNHHPRVSLEPRHAVIFSLLAVLSAPVFAADLDNDGVEDPQDNCSAIANPLQRDTDSDGFGNLCDTDLNNDDVTNVLDIGIFKAAFGTPGPNADFNGDGIVNVLDIGFLKRYFGFPPGPGALVVADISDVEAARFLNQATFGANAADITHLQNLNDFDAWLSEQRGIPASLTLAASRAMYQANYEYCISDPPEWGCPDPLAEIVDTSHDFFRYMWWQNAVEAPDQLRQRVAFALSQILVVSDKSPDLANAYFGLAHYYDVLLTHAFGNYRDLIEAVTLHPVMGSYLSMVRNEKPDTARNIRPDENYARELMQLLTIGVHELNLDGSVVLDAQNKPIPSYKQSTVENFARVFTGWNFANIDWWEWPGNADRTQAMVAWEEYHDTDAKTLLNGVNLPAGQTAAQDLDAALDNVFAHSNVGPFIAAQLIKRLVTSNPSPEYIARVATVFNDNGNDERGDLFAVVRAILLDPEVRDESARPAHHGKLREPMLRLSHLFRAFNATPRPQGDWDVPPSVAVYNSPANWSIRVIDNVAGQNVLGAPSVFNFYRPDYAPRGPVDDAGLVAPEFQIATENTIIGMSNLINFHIQDASLGGNWTYLDFTPEVGLLGQPQALMDRLDLLLMGGVMSANVRQRVLDHLADDSFPNNANGDLARVRDAVSLLVNSPDYLVQQ